MVIFAPMDQFGWFSACSTVTSFRFSLDRPKKGPPEAVRRMRLSRRSGGQLAAGDEGLLVGKGDGLPRFDGIHGGQEPGDADDGVEDRVRVRVGGTFTDPADAGQYFRVRVGDADPEVGSRRFVEKSDLVRVELPDLLFHGLHTGAGGQGADTDAVLAGDVQALGADGTGGTEDGEVFRHTAPTTIP